MVSTDILVHLTNRRARVEECVKALLAHTPSNTNVVFLGNKLSGAVARFVLRFCRQSKVGGSISLLGNQVGLSRGAIFNRGLVRCKSEYVVVMDDCNIVTKGWLEGLHDCMLSEPSLGIVCPGINGGIRQALVKGMPENLTIDALADLVKKTASKKYPRITSAESCMMIKRDVLRAFNRFDSDCEFPEVDYCHRVRKAGFGIAVADDVFVYDGSPIGLRPPEQHDDIDKMEDCRRRCKRVIKKMPPTATKKILTEHDEYFKQQVEAVRKIEKQRKRTYKAVTPEHDTTRAYKRERRVQLNAVENPRGLDYIIPIANVGGDDFEDRLLAINYIIEYFLKKQTGLNLHLIIVEQVIDPSFPAYIPRINPKGLDHTFVTVKHQTFVKPWLYNIGVAQTKYDGFIVAESEVFSQEDYLRDVLDFADEKGLSWCFCWNRLYYLSQKCRDVLISEGKITVEMSTRGGGYYDALSNGLCFSKIPSHAGAEGGMVYFQRDFWLSSLHGANELLRELGGNDNDLAYRAHRLSGTYEKYPITVYHMWHPMSQIKRGRFKTLNMGFFKWLEQGQNYLTMSSILAEQTLGDKEKPVPMSLGLMRRIPVFDEWKKVYGKV